MATKFNTEKIRFSYLKMIPELDEQGNLKYGAMLIIDKSDKKTIKRIEEAISEAYIEGKGTLGIKSKSDIIPDDLKVAFYDGDKKRPDDENCRGKMILNTSSSTKPTVVSTERDENNKFKEISDLTQIYSGMYGRASVTIKAYNVGKSKGLGVYLNNIQKLADGPALAGKSSAQTDFDDDSEWNEYQDNLDGSGSEEDDDLM